MRGDTKVIEFLNEQLTAELTAINQYFLHAKMQENWGYPKLGGVHRAESIDEMRHAEVLTDRILFLEGLPNYQRLLPLKIGQTLAEMFEADMAIEVAAVDRLRGASSSCARSATSPARTCSSRSSRTRNTTSTTSRPSSSCIDKLGEQLYLAQLVEQPSG